MNRRVESVLFVSTSFPRFRNDLAGSFVFRFARYLARDGMQVTALAPGEPHYPAREEMDGVQIYRYPYFYPRCWQWLTRHGHSMLTNIRHSWVARLQVPFFMLATMWAIWSRQDHFDLIHCHWLPTAVAALLARPFSRRKPPIVFTNWGSDTRLLPAWLGRWVVRQVDGCVSTAVETDEHLERLGRKEFRRVMAPVDEERFAPEAVSPDLRDELSLAPDTPVIPFIGRLDAFKDPLTFIRACALLKQRGVVFAAPIAGDGDLMETCRQEILAGDVQDCVQLLGMRSDPERLLRVATATVHISPVENTWANVIAEAMWMRVSVILSDAGYTRRLFTDRQNCLIVPAQNPAALADALQQLIENLSLRQQLIVGGHELLRQYKKDSISIVQELRTCYDEIWTRRQI